jgi:uncharacterized protein YecE (DUF72 family)
MQEATGDLQVMDVMADARADGRRRRREEVGGKTPPYFIEALVLVISCFYCPMSRSSSLRQTLQLSSDHSIEVLSIEPSGDCFYDSIHALLCKTADIQHFSGTPLFMFNNGDDDASLIPSPQTMRRYVSQQLTSEQFELYQMFAAAGVDEYSFMMAKGCPKDLPELQAFANRSGKEYGPGKCLWADEFALRTVSDGLHLTLLIVDDQAERSGRGSAKRKRSDSNDPSQADSRFISIGNYGNAVILHRSRREHFNGVLIDGCGSFDLKSSPVSYLWPATSVLLQNKNVNERKSEKPSINDGSNSCSEAKITDDRDKQEKVDLTHPTPGKFFVGCAGFSNSNWVGNFYPKNIVGHNSERQLSHYQSHFSSVELNATFYGVPSESTVLKWKNLCAKSFRLVAKAPKGVTHELDILNGSTLTYFLNRMKPLKDVLVCVLIQCPRTLIVDVSQLEQLHSELEEKVDWYCGHLAFEFRNQTTFHDAGVRKFLNEKKWTFVVHPDSLERSTVGSSVSGRRTTDLQEYEPQKLSQFASTCSVAAGAGIVYVRLHGSNDEHTGEYNADQLNEIGQQIHNWRIQGRDVYCFFLNDCAPSMSSPQKSHAEYYEKWASMPKNAKQLEKLVFELSKEEIPDAPTKPKATMLNFFTKK